MKRKLIALALIAAATSLFFLKSDVRPAFDVEMHIDISKPGEEFRPIWAFYGADEPNYTYMKDGSALLGELGELSPDKTYFRVHNLLTSGDGTPALKWGSTNAYTEDENGDPIYDWKIVDQIFKAGLDRGVKPYVEIGFMPEALSTQPAPYQHEWYPGGKNTISTGWAYPPEDYEKWAELVYQLVKHSVDTYGKEEVEQWYWEVWNEPDLNDYWNGTDEEFYKLHDYAVDAVLRALPTARVGGPDMASSDPTYMRNFFKHVLEGENYATGKTGTQTDFVSFHAKGRASIVDGRAQLDIGRHLSVVEQGFKTISSVPELKNIPVILGESDPEGCAACLGDHLDYRNTEMYASYTAMSIARQLELAKKYGVNLEGSLTWAFEFENDPFFQERRALATRGIAKPVLNVFRMFSMMSGNRVPTASSGRTPLNALVQTSVRLAPEVDTIATLDDRKLAVLIWHYHDDSAAGNPARVKLSVTGLPTDISTTKVTHYRIDETHSNAYTTWKRMGSTQDPTPEEYQRLKEAGELQKLEHGADSATVRNGEIQTGFMLPRHGVSLLVFEW